jgi:hypothetical protein
MLAAGVPEMRMTYLPKGAYRILDTTPGTSADYGAPAATISW